METQHLCKIFKFQVEEQKPATSQLKLNVNPFKLQLQQYASDRINKEEEEYNLFAGNRCQGGH